MKRQKGDFLSLPSFYDLVGYFAGEVVKRFSSRNGLEKPWKENCKVQGNNIQMLTALYVVTSWVQRCCRAITFYPLRIPPLFLWGMAGVFISILLVFVGNHWPKPTEKLDLSRILYANAAKSQEWKEEDQDHTSFDRFMEGEIPHELHPGYNYITRKPLVIANIGLSMKNEKNIANTGMAPHSQASHPSPTPEKSKEKEDLPSVNGVYHHVKSGENPWLLARLYDVSLEKIAKYNPSMNPNRIMEGDKLFIPEAKEPLTYSKSQRMIYPLRNSTYITSGYGNRKHPLGGGIRFHKGVDFRADRGTPIQAVLDGTVIEAGNRGLLGLVVSLRHDNGLETVYAHNSRIKVKVGQRVKQGDIIAYVGSTGRTTGAHLHFEVLQNGKHQNPVKFLPGSQSRYNRR